MSNTTHAGALGEKLIQECDKMIGASPEEFAEADRKFKEAAKHYIAALKRSR